MKTNRLIVLLLAMVMVSCGKESQTQTIVNPAVQDSYSYVIPVEQALQNLTDFLDQTGLKKTKSVDSGSVSGVITVHSNRNTKSAVSDTPLLYATNFEDGGYAIMAADKRIDAEVIAVTERGTITEDDFKSYDSFIADEDDDITEEMYNELSKDGYVGISDKKSTTMLVANLSRDYAENDLRGDGFSTGGGFSMGSSSSEAESYSWVVKKNVDYLLTTVWNQRSPFNDLCPNVGLFKREKASAGCVPIAVGQIIAYHEYPSITANGIYVDFEKIKAIRSKFKPYEEGDELSKAMAANYIQMISTPLCCDVIYGKVFGTPYGFALPTSAKRCFEALGYQNVELNWNYDEDRVIKSIDNGCPVFMSAIAGLVSGHAWVVDGYMKRQYVSDSGKVAYDQCLVHCNWGWMGSNNGYFVSGIFKTSEGVIFDNDRRISEDENYWYAFNTITYEKP